MLAPRLVLLLLLLKKMSLVLGYSSFSGRHSPHQRHIVPPSLSSSFRPVDNLDGPVLVPFLVDGTKFVDNGDDDDLFEDEVEDDWQIDEDANMRVASYDRGWDEDDDAGVDVGVAGAGDVAGAGAGAGEWGSTVRKRRKSGVEVKPADNEAARFEKFKKAMANGQRAPIGKKLAKAKLAEDVVRKKRTTMNTNDNGGSDGSPNRRFSKKLVSM